MGASELRAYELLLSEPRAPEEITNALEIAFGITAHVTPTVCPECGGNGDCPMCGCSGTADIEDEFYQCATSGCTETQAPGMLYCECCVEKQRIG